MSYDDTPAPAASYIPARLRRAAYVVLATAQALELIWDLVPAALEGKVLASLSALGFGMAAINVKAKG